MKLSALTPGASAVVHAICCEEELKEQLHALGVIPGVRIMPILTAPLGSPQVFEVMGTRIALRPEEVSEIVVVDAIMEATAKVKWA